MNGAYKSSKSGLIIDHQTKFIEKINSYNPIDFKEGHHPEKGFEHRNQRARDLEKWHADHMTSNYVLQHREQIALLKSANPNRAKSSRQLRSHRIVESD